MALLDWSVPAAHLANQTERDPAPAVADVRGDPAATTDVDDGFEWLRADTLRVLMYALAAALWLVLVRYLAQPDDFWPGWGAALAALGVVAGAHALAPTSYQRSSRLLVAGLALIVTARTIGGIHDGVALFLYIPVVLVGGTLQRTRAAILVAALATIALLVHVALGTASIGSGAALEILAVIWLTALTSWLVTRNLYTALHWSWQNQEAATRNLEAARRHRGELARALHQLEDAKYRLERSNHALNWARLEAEEAREVKARFAAHVSHELRTPINLIVGFGDMMLNVPESYGAARLPTEYLADLQTLNRSAKHLQGLIDDILDLSQLDAKEMPLMREQVDVASLVGEAVATIRPLLERKRLALELDVPADALPIHVDPLRIRQVLLNLLSNASRHTSRGGITVSVRQHEERVTIAVSDTGDGIAPRDLPHLFQAFHRLAPSAGSAHEGWGLGLAICKQFVELHGGQIAAHSDGIPGHGATFTLTLPAGVRPLAPFWSSRPGHPPRARSAALAPKRAVVVLEGDPHAVGLCRRYLSGYDVHGASSEPEALDLARALGAHALLVPIAGGPDRTAWHERWSCVAHQEHLRVIGCSLASSRQLAAAFGLAEFLVKPVARETLLAVVERLRPGATTIGVVDDDTHMVRLLSRMLQSSGRGYRVVRAYSGAEGVGLIRRTRPDLVLLDLMLPDMDGLAVAGILRADPALSSVAVVAVTAQDAAEVLPAPAGRAISLVSDRGLSLTQTLQEVRALLDALPPPEIVEIVRTAPDRAPEAGPLASAASG